MTVLVALSWATCPVTQSEFVRVSSNHRVISDARTPGEAAHLLARLRAVGGHVFWSDAVPDVHLLLLARSNDGEVATFDRGLASRANRLGARAALIGSS